MKDRDPVQRMDEIVKQLTDLYGEADKLLDAYIERVGTKGNGRMKPHKRSIKQKTAAEVADELIRAYDVLNTRANDLVDDFIETVMHPRTLSVPCGVIRQCGFTAKAGFAPNLPEELRLLKQMAKDYA